MNNTNELILKLTQNGDFHPPVASLINSDNLIYKIVWMKNNASANGIKSFSIDYEFNINSFFEIYNERYPENTIDREFVMIGISLCINELAHLALVGGKDIYVKLAELFYKKRGQIGFIPYGA